MYKVNERLDRINTALLNIHKHFYIKCKEIKKK